MKYLIAFTIVIMIAAVVLFYSFSRMSNSYTVVSVAPGTVAPHPPPPAAPPAPPTPANP